MAPRPLRILSIGPQHAGGQRQRGDRSKLRIVVDLGLKTQQAGIIEMDEAEASQFAGLAAMSAAQVAQANASYREHERIEDADRGVCSVCGGRLNVR